MVSTMYPDGQELKTTIYFEVSVAEGNEHIIFKIIETNPMVNITFKPEYKVKLVKKPCHFGGRRWWFCCPNVVNGQVCGKKVGALYLPFVDGKGFACRKCHNLAYESSKWLRF
jgi:hypothetical protein